MEESKEETPKAMEEAAPKGEEEIAAAATTTTTPDAASGTAAATSTPETAAAAATTTTTPVEEKKEAAKAEEMATTEEAKAVVTEEKKVEETKKDESKTMEPAVDTKTETTTTAGRSNKRERRSRKSAETFQPVDFVHTDRSVQIMDGRGKKLSDLKATRESIEQYTGTSEEAFLMHRLLYTTRGRPPKREIKANILGFSGYLPKKEKGLSKKEQDAKDEDHEAKMGAKAYKLTIPQLKTLCDFLAVDRAKCTTKDEIIDKLLDFLGEPSDKYLKKAKGSAPAAKKSKTSKTQSTTTKEADDDDDDDDDDSAKADDDSYSEIGADEEIIKPGDEPTDEALRKWVRAYVRCHNMKNSTIKNALEIAGDKFGTDLSDKKARMKELLTEEM